MPTNDLETLLSILEAEGFDPHKAVDWAAKQKRTKRFADGDLTAAQVRAEIASNRADLLEDGFVLPTHPATITAAESSPRIRRFLADRTQEAEQDVAEGSADSEDRSVLAQQEAVREQLNLNGQIEAALLELSGGTPVDAQKVLEILTELNPNLDMSNGIDSLAIHMANERTAQLVQVAVARATEGSIGGWVPVQTGTRAFRDPATGKRKHEATFTHIRGDHYDTAVSRFPALSDQIGRAVTLSKQSGIDWRFLMAVADADTNAEGSSFQGPEEDDRPFLLKMLGPKPEPVRMGTGMQMRDAFAASPAGRLGALNRELAEKARMFSGSMELALLARKDENLARAIYERGYATPSEAGQVSVLMGTDYEELAAMGAPLNPMKLEALLGNDPYGGSGGGGGVQYTLPDPASVRNEVTNLFRAWFQRDPVEGEAEAFLGQINNAVIGEAKSRSKPGTAGNIFKGIDPVQGQDGVAGVTDVDPQARLLEYARSNPDYQRLFAERPMGMSEDEYAGQFSGAATQFLGGQAAAPSAVRAGMETGSLQTTLGAALASEAAQESSSLLGRMARAAQLINGET